MSSLKPGIYEQLINKEVKGNLSNIDEKTVKVDKIDTGTSPIVLSQYVKDVVRKAMERQDDVSKQQELANEIISLVSEKVDPDLIENELPSEEKQLLLEIEDKTKPNFKKNRPASSLTHSYLFTGDIDMPLVQELKREILTSDKVDILVSFLKVSGIAMIREALKEFTNRGGQLRIITTTYMGATEANAVDELAHLPNTEIHISYDTKHTRLHAKSYIFHRNTGFHTAYVGSSNLSKAAITDGREWNVKITSNDQPDVFEQMKETFEIYWHSTEFEPYKIEDLDRLAEAINSERNFTGQKKSIYTYSFDITPFPFQQVILDQLEAERKLRGNRNLVVAATGTGKTVISALDYKNFRNKHIGKVNSLLFVAHREEILEQSMYKFREVLKDPNFGDMLVGSHIPTQRSHLFASIQSINSKQFTQVFAPDHFDFIIIDEFHHAAAQSYQDILEYFTPQILLGLTATPERADGKDILQYFSGNHIAAEIRLPEAIERQLLCPFHYYGVTDNTDLSTLKWTAGGYDKSDLENVYVLSEVAAQKRAQLILNSIPRYVENATTVKCIGFCVSIAHAEFMAKFFNEHGVPALALSSKSKDEERNSAKALLESGKINYIFVVDLYNEGVDIPDIDMVLFLRPTESLTVFLQQLGRGLRVSEGKEFLTVLDFIGQANKKYRFEEKFKALLTASKHGIISEIKEGFVSVPKGCYIELEKTPQEIILNNIKAALGTRESIIEKIRSFESDSALSLTLEHFLNYTHIPVRDLYKHGSFTRLCSEAGKRKYYTDSFSDDMEKAFKKIAYVDSRRWIVKLLQFMKSEENISYEKCTSEEKAMLDMFQYTVYMDQKENMTAEAVINKARSNPSIREELVELLSYRLQNINFIDEPVMIGATNPLDCYCTYSRDQILSGLGYTKPSTVRQGVFYLHDKKVDTFFITLNKSDKDFSPTTLYKDYAISKDLFHWESQSTTAADSPTGKRYRTHKENGSYVFLFVRESKNDQYGPCPYTFLGPAEFVSSEGSKPMSIIWKLKYPIPARFMKGLSKGIAL